MWQCCKLLMLNHFVKKHLILAQNLETTKLNLGFILSIQSFDCHIIQVIRFVIHIFRIYFVHYIQLVEQL